MKRSYDSWREEVIKLKIRCQWGTECGGEELATCKAHIIGEKTFSNNVRGDEEGDLNELLNERIESEQYDQTDTNVAIGITCGKCDTHIRTYESDKNKFIPITLWKVAAKFYLSLYSGCTHYPDSITFNNSINPNLEQIELVKQITFDYLERDGDWRFTTLDAEAYENRFKKYWRKDRSKLKLLDSTPHALGFGFCGSSGREDSYMNFDIYSRSYVISAFRNDIPKMHIMEHHLKNRIESPTVPTVITQSNNRDSDNNTLTDKAINKVRKELINNLQENGTPELYIQIIKDASIDQFLDIMDEVKKLTNKGDKNENK